MRQPAVCRYIGNVTDLAAPAQQRIGVLDMARGAALLAMFVYHLAWDAHYFGLSATDPSANAGWKLVSHGIAASFLFLAGVSLVLGQHRRLNDRLRRLAVLAAAALAITLATWLAVPDATITFGILHCILFASLLALPVLRLPLPLLVLTALAMFAAPILLASPVFDGPWLAWTGLNIAPPRTLDYRPLLPFAAALFAGVVAARLGQGTLRKLQLRSGFVPLRTLAFAGRHSLAIYLLHQPVFLALLWSAAAVLPVPAPDAGAGFLEACQSACTISGQTPAACAASCGCVKEELQSAGLWARALSNKLDAEGTQTLQRLAQACRSATPPTK